MALSNFFWDSAEPVNGTLIPDGPQAWRYLVGNVTALFGSEHHTFPTTTNIGAWHLPGSAVLLTGTDRPTARIDASAFDENDNGRLFFDTDVEELEVLTAFGGPTWVSFGSLSAAHTWALAQTFSSGFTSTVAPTWTAGVVGSTAWVTGDNEADDATINLIKAGRNVADDADVAFLPDSARLATDADPVENTELVVKKYVDTQISSNTDGDIHTFNDSESNAIRNLYR